MQSILILSTIGRISLSIAVYRFLAGKAAPEQDFDPWERLDVATWTRTSRLDGGAAFWTFEIKSLLRPLKCDGLLGI